MSLAFGGSSASSLRALAAALRSGTLTTPLSPLSLERVAPGCTEADLAVLMQLSGDGMRPDHLALFVETLARSMEERLAGCAELVWTGPESPVAHSRDTAVVVAELFRSARTSVLVSTFVLHQVETVFLPLADQMALVPDLRVQLFVHVGRKEHDTRHESEVLREYGDALRRRWPGSRLPLVYYDPRSLATNDADRATWHAKVVVIDDERAFVTSANFTEWAQQRNVEAGLLVTNPQLARQIRFQFDSLVQSRAVVEVPGFRA